MSKYKANSVLESMGFALRGIFVTLKSQLNFRIEVVIAIMGFILALYLRFTYVELAIFVNDFSKGLRTVLSFSSPRT